MYLYLIKKDDPPTTEEIGGRVYVFGKKFLKKRPSH
jgi:hypothetical protein